MILYDKLENLKIKRRAGLVMPNPVEKETIGLFNLNARTLNETADFIKRLDNARHTAYKYLFTNKKYNFKLFNKLHVEKADSKLELLQLKKNVRILKLVSNIFKTDECGFVDTSRFNDVFFSNIISHDGVKNYLNFVSLMDIYRDYAGFSRNIVIYDLKDIDVKSDENFNKKNQNIISIMFNMLKNHKEDFDNLPFEFLFINGNEYVKLIPGDDNSTAIKFKETVKRFSKHSESVQEDSKEELTDELIDGIVDDMGISKIISNYFSGQEYSNLSKEMKKTVKEVLLEKSMTVDDLLDENISKEVIEESKKRLDANKEFVAELALLASKNTAGSPMTKRDALLKKRQELIKINNEGDTIKDIVNRNSDGKLESTKLNIDVLNEDYKKNSFMNFVTNYTKKLKDRDMIGMINDFAKKDIPLYVTKIEREDTSDSFDKKETVRVVFESNDRIRHHVTFDVPKLMDDYFLKLGGNKKTIISQLILKPVVKTGPSTVQLCSNYNKIFIRRVGKNLSPKTEKVKKVLASADYPVNKLKINYGDNRQSNLQFLTTLEYDELGSVFMDVKCGSTFIIFNQNNMQKYLKDHNIQYAQKDTLIPVAIDNGKVVELDGDTSLIKGTKMSFTDYFIDTLNKTLPDFKDKVMAMNVGKKYLYSEATIMSKKIPVALLLSYLEGITTMLRKANIKYEFVEKARLTGEDVSNKGVIEFADGSLVFERYPYRNSILLNGLSSVPTKEFTFSEFDGKEVYLKIFEIMYNNRIVLNALDNFYAVFIDFNTARILRKMGIPDDFTSLVIYANNLLEDSQFIPEINMNNYRLRNAEIINSVIYKNLADAYCRYRGTYGNKHPVKVSIPKDKIIKDLLTSVSIKDTNTINPDLEAEELRSVTFKGPNGLNQERAYTLQKRVYDKSMRGIVAMSTPPSGAAGIVKQLAFDVNLLDEDGFLDITEDGQEDTKLNSANMQCPSEAIVTYSTMMDDGPRVLMITTQNKHVIPCADYDELLITNGSDSALPSVISNDFCYKAKQDGKIVDFDEKNNLIIIQYKDGTYDAIDTDVRMAKNGGGGFSINNRLQPTIKGTTFKKGDILAQNPLFFSSVSKSQSKLKVGALVKVAVEPGSFNYEDSCMPTQKLAKKLSSNVSMEDNATLGANSNILQYVKVGDRVEVGDPLVTFDTSYESSTGLNDFLNSLKVNGDDADLGLRLSSNRVKASHAGVIKSIEVYYTTDYENMSESLVKMIEAINKPLKAKRNKIKKYIKNVDQTNIQLNTVDKVEPKNGKIRGIDVQEGDVVVRYFIEHEDIMGVGDKLFVTTALKATCCDVIEEGKEPYTMSRPDEEISLMISPISYLARQTNTLLLNGFGNHVLVGTKRTLNDIYLANQK